jgi:hypothetical protein
MPAPITKRGLALEIRDVARLYFIQTSRGMDRSMQRARILILRCFTMAA